jgi:hypothetical protein
LQSLAQAVLDGKSGAEEAIANAARARAEELQEHPRVLTAVEQLRYFCGILRLVFNEVAAPTRKRTVEEAWRNCRHFAMEMLSIAGIDHDFDAHPERPTEYLGTDVP